MTVKVLVVDDSRFFRRRIEQMLTADPGISVVGTAENGREALRQAAVLKPDVVTMDIEMPVMDGITAVRRLMARQPTPVLMFSSLTHDGAQATLDALEAGALDFLPKQFDAIAQHRDDVTRLLQDRVRALARRGASLRLTAAPKAARSVVAPQQREQQAVPALRLRDFDVLVIGASTGGPVALQKVLTRLPRQFPLPILLIQHMPASFTPAFAQRLDGLCAIEVAEAQDGDALKPGQALLAPGGRQLGIAGTATRPQARLFDVGPEQFYRPSLDVTFTEVARAFPGRSLAIVLTGMGADGCEGARALKRGGATVWAQDEDSSVIYGMPGAVARAGLTDRILSLDEIGPALVQGG